MASSLHVALPLYCIALQSVRGRPSVRTMFLDSLFGDRAISSRPPAHSLRDARATRTDEPTPLPNETAGSRGGQASRWARVVQANGTVPQNRTDANRIQQQQHSSIGLHRARPRRLGRGRGGRAQGRAARRGPRADRRADEVLARRSALGLRLRQRRRAGRHVRRGVCDDGRRRRAMA